MLQEDNKNLSCFYSYILEFSNKIISLSSKFYLRTRLIVFDGNLFTNSIIIGEAPGKNENEKLRIFIGKSGKIVRDYFENKGVLQSILFINSIPWRPEENRTPKKDEIMFYSSIWKEFFKKNKNINNVLCLGSVAKKFFQGFYEEINIKSVFFARHPAYLIYKRDKQEELTFFENLDSFIANIDISNRSYQRICKE